jgi:hypothetical protein
MNTPMPHNPVSDAQLDAALSAEHDQILPSSGFADSVMAAVRADADAPAPIPFPWKRTIPGLVGAAAGLAFLAALVSALISAFVHSGPASASNGKLDFAPLLHHAIGPDTAWIALSLAIPLLCLIALRRFIFFR